MSWLDNLSYRLSALRERGRHEEELDDELRFHLEMEIERRMAAGESRAQAARAARLAFGAPEAVKEACREAWGTRWLDEIWRDLRNAGRQLLAAPTLAVVVIASLAIGLGTATVVFSIVDAVLLRPLPYGDPSRIVVVHELTPQGDRFSSSDPNLLDFRRHSQALAEVAALAFPMPRPALARDGSRVRLTAQAVTPTFFTVLGVDARLGRTFGPAEERPGDTPKVVVLTDQGWRRHFDQDPAIVGNTIDLDGERWAVLGVLPEDFRYGGPVDAFLPFVLDADHDRGDRRLTGHARLAPGFTREQAEQELNVIAASLAADFPGSNDGWRVELQPLEDLFLGPTVRQTSKMLLAAVALLLLLACVNVSNLLLARGDDRLDEMRLRLALGAGRGRVVRSLLIESTLFGLLGATGALLLASWAVPWIRGLDVALPRMDQMSLNLRLVALMIVAAILASLFFGIVPALRATAVSVGVAARSRRQGAGPASSRLRATLVVAEVALATVLTAGAGLLLHSFERLQQVDAGFASGGVLLAQIDLPQERYPEGSGTTTDFYRRLIERVEVLPGVAATGATMVSPFRGPNPKNKVASENETEREAFVPINWRAVTPGYFRAAQIPMLRGRSFDPKAEVALEAVISADLAARLWPGQEAIGESLRWLAPDGALFEVVGVVGEVRDVVLEDEPWPTVYLPQRLVGWSTMTLAARSDGPLDPLAKAVRDVVGKLDPLLAAPDFSTLASQRREALGRPLLSLRLMAVTALIAVLLSAVGIYGVVAYAVSRRRREMGVRVALGARSRQLVSLIVKDGARWVVAGLVLGLLASLGLTGLMRTLLYRTSPFEPWVMAAVACMEMLVGLTACALPARRAAGIDPLLALRQE